MRTWFLLPDRLLTAMAQSERPCYAAHSGEEIGSGVATVVRQVGRPLLSALELQREAQGRLGLEGG